MAGRPRPGEAVPLIFVDSSVWIDYFNGSDTPATERLHALLGREPLIVGDIVVTEVLQGFRRDRDFRMARDVLKAFDVIGVLGPERAVRAAENHRNLRRRGVTVRKTIDTLIATCCIDEGLRLLHSDRDFQPFVRYLGLQEVA